MKMKCSVVAALISLVFAWQASAVLRPLFPIKPSAPFNGELIVIGDELVLRYRPRDNSCPFSWLRKDLQAREMRHVIGTRERKARFRRDLERFGVTSFIST
jgi:hypothetical protein